MQVGNNPSRKHMLGRYSEPGVRTEFDHIWYGPFSPRLPVLPPLGAEIIGYKTSVESHHSPPPAPARPRRSSSHHKAPLDLISGALNVVDRGRLFSSPFYGLRGRSSHWPRPCWTTRSLNPSFCYVKSQLSTSSLQARSTRLDLRQG